MLKKMRINKRLTFSFIVVSAITSIAAIVGCIAMVVMTSEYNFALVNYGFSQGDIGKAMITFADARSATRAVISYTDEEIIEESLATHVTKKEACQGYLETIKKTLSTAEEIAVYDRIESGVNAYWNKDEEVITLGNTLDEEQSKRAQQMAAEELDPLYDGAYADFTELMVMNVDRGNELDASLKLLRNILLVFIIAVIVLAFVISFIMGKKIADGIANPLGALCDRLKTFAGGNLSDSFPTVDSQDEVSEMVKEASVMAENLSIIIKDAGEMLGEMAEGNYAIKNKMEERYVGDFYKLIDAMRLMNRKMNITLRQIEEASSQVAAGSINMAESAQTLAEGATEQAGAVEELQATIVNITEGVEKTAVNVEESYRQAQMYAEEADKSRGEMKELVNAMERINETSQLIENIISEIEDIATQTNLLSLNAAIEAARAGEAGKGFAVVADQIGKLADQSAKSAVDTRQLIESSIKEVEEGNSAAGRAAVSIEEVVKGVKMIAESSKALSEISSTQATAMKQAELGVNQISDVVQSNSATAEETSATSEELSAQAETLKELVGQFTLKDVNV